MFKLKSILFVGALASMVVSQQSCVKDYTDFDKVSKTVDYSPSVAGAVAHTKLTVRDIIRDYDDDELFEEGSNGFLYLMYDKRIYTKAADELISLSDQAFPTMDQYNKTTYDAAPLENGYKHFPEIPLYYDFLVSNQEQLDSVHYDAIDINVKVNSTFTEGGILNLTFPALVKNGQPFVANIHPDASGNFHYDLTTHLEDYSLVFSSNRVLVNFDLKLTDGTASSSDQLDITISMNNQNFQGLFGYIGRINTPIPQDTVNISIFDNAFNGSVYFQDPSMTLHISNTFGMPITNYFGDLQTYSEINGGIWESHNFPIDELNINHPTQVGDTATQTEILNTTNFPEIRDVIASQPRYLFFEVDSVIVNPDGYDASLPNFVLDTSRVSIDLEVKLPLWGNALYSLVDTLELNIEENFEDVSKHFVEANMRTIFDNFLPTNAYAQVIFTDSLYHPLDTLYKTNDIGERLIQSAILDVDGRAKQSVKKTTDILFGNGSSYEHDINDLQYVRYAVIIATLKTEGIDNTSDVNGNSRLVKFYGDNFLEVKFGLKGQGKYQEVIN